MDCLKQEANNLRTVAEKYILNKDYTGARGTILRAREIFPGLENVVEILAICDVLCAADLEFPVCGVDWYWILQLPPSVDDLTIAAQYKKLTTLVEPMINKFEGAESAMKILNEAFYVLSDKSKRLLFDSKRSASRNDGECWLSVTLDGSELDTEEDGAGRNESITGLAKGEKIGRDETYNGGDLMCIPKDLPSKRQRDLGGVSVKEWLGNAFTSMVSNGDMENIGGQGVSWISTAKKSRGDQAERAESSVPPCSVNVVKQPAKTKCNEPGSNTQNLKLDVLDSDTQCYKRQWAAEDFLEDQVWAIYDGPDNMPRSYIKVNKVIPEKKVSVTYLEPHPMQDDQIRWIEEELPSVCGIFRLGRATANLEMSSFSHLVKCDRSTKKSFYKIYPRKGEIWAMYKNWQSNWHLSDLNKNQSEVVEILSDFDEEQGTIISLLVQVKGFLTFFERKTYEGFDLTRTVTRKEMLRFSHRIPAYLALGVESYDIPKNSWHLEADALPSNF